MAAEKSNATPAAANQQGNDRMREIESYVRAEEKRLPQLQRKETVLDDKALGNATDEKWSKLHTYADSGKVVRLKVYPSAGGKKTEEFYYRGDQLVHVFIEPAGANKRGHDADARGSRYYFEGGRLIGAMEDGRPIDVNDGKVRDLGAKLLRESKAFRSAAK